MGRPGFERFQRLTPAARMLLGLLWEMRSRGLFWLPDERAAEILGLSRKTIVRARWQLIREGLVECPKQDGTRRPVLYRLTALAVSSNVPSECPIESPEMSHLRLKSLTPRGSDDLPWPEELPRLKGRDPSDRSRIYEPRKTLEGPPVRFDRERRRELQAGYFKQAEEARKAQELRPKETEDPAPWGPSREISPIGGKGFHHQRGKIHGKHKPANGIGFTRDEQGARILEEIEKNRREEQENLPPPVSERGRPAEQVTLLLWDGDSIPSGLAKSPLAKLLMDKARQGRLL